METSEAVVVRKPERARSRPVSFRRNDLLRAGFNMLLLAMIAVPLVHCVQFTLDLLTEPYTGYDFSAYYAGGLVLRTHPYASLFDLSTLQAAARAHGAAVPSVIYTYPPLLAILMMPLTLLPYRVALGLWTVLNFALWLFCAALLVSWFRRMLMYGIGLPQPGGDAQAATSSGGEPAGKVLAPRLFSLAVAGFLVLSYQPIEQTLVLGQVSVLMLALLLLAPLLAEHDHPYLAALALALAIWIKPFPVVLIVYYLLRGRWRVAGGTAAGLALVALAQVPLVGVGGVLDVGDMLSHGVASSTQFQNEALARVPLWVAAEFGGHLSSPVALVGGALVALVGIAFCAALWRMGSLGRLRSHTATSGAAVSREVVARNRELIGYCWALATMVLVAPITWEHYDSWLLPCIVLCLALAIHSIAGGFRNAEGRLRGGVYILAAMIVAYVITMHHLPLGYDGTAAFAIGPYIGGRPLRPFFMLLRPTAALLAWLCCGALFLRTSTRSGTLAANGETGDGTPLRQMRLSRAIQGGVLAGLLGAACIMEGILIALLIAFGPYQPK